MTSIFLLLELRLGCILVNLNDLLTVGAEQPVHQVDGEGEHHGLVLLCADAVERLKEEQMVVFFLTYDIDKLSEDNPLSTIENSENETKYGDSVKFDFNPRHQLGRLLPKLVNSIPEQKRK